MHKKSTNIKFNSKLYATVKTVFKYCLFLLFTFAFSLQQFSAFAYTQLAKNTTKETGSNLHSQHLLSNSQLSYHLPFAPNPLEWEMEFVEEEDDNSSRKGATADCKTFISDKYAAGELNYTTSLTIRYLQLASSVSKQPAIPFFILHHSWKSYLS